MNLKTDSDLDKGGPWPTLKIDDENIVRQAIRLAQFTRIHVARSGYRREGTGAFP